MEPGSGTLIRRSFQGHSALILLVVPVLGEWPSWGYSRHWGYAPSGGLGLVMPIIMIPFLMGTVPHLL